MYTRDCNLYVTNTNGSDYGLPSNEVSLFQGLNKQVEVLCRHLNILCSIHT